MINELLMDNEIYIARKDSHKIKVEEMDPKIEYHPCDDNEGSCIIINGYKYSIVLKKINWRFALMKTFRLNTGTTNLFQRNFGLTHLQKL